MPSGISRYMRATNVIAVAALIFAMAGGAFAATGDGGHSGSAAAQATKKKSKSKASTGKRGPRGPEGKPGPEGKEGKAGPEGKEGKAGPEGKAGTNGTDGTNGKEGTAGKPVVLVSETPANCAEGGYTYEVEGSGAANEVCNGERGALHAGETLPVDATETGTFSTPEPIDTTSGQELDVFMQVSFPIKLKSQAWTFTEFLEEHYEFIEANGTHVTATSSKEECKGTVAEPTAPAGFFCVYAGVEGANGANSETAGWKGLLGEGVLSGTFPVLPYNPAVQSSSSSEFAGLGIAATGARLLMKVKESNSEVELAGTWAMSGF